MSPRLVLAAAVVVLLPASGTEETSRAVEPASAAERPAQSQRTSAASVTAPPPARRRLASLATLERRMTALDRALRPHERDRARLLHWWGCITTIPVDRIGDVHHRWGFEYDERDGTGLDTRPALVRHTGRGRPDLLFLRFGRRCASHAPDPNGTGEDARRVPPRARPPLGRPVVSRTAHKRPTRLVRAERRAKRLERRVVRLERAFDRFDEWESCLSWLPVTEFGHDHQSLGFRFEQQGRIRYLGAVDTDDTEWDDPDYELLAFLGRDRPFVDRECGHEPGESVDRRIAPRRVPGHATGHATAHGAVHRRHHGPTRGERLQDLRSDLRDLSDDLEDLGEPVQEFVQFDECMFTVGMRSRGGPTSGFRYRDAHGRVVRRSALSFDMTGLRLPQLDVMAFPGEEPPQIECNEDAAGEGTDE